MEETKKKKGILSAVMQKTINARLGMHCMCVQCTYRSLISASIPRAHGSIFVCYVFRTKQISFCFHCCALIGFSCLPIRNVHKMNRSIAKKQLLVANQRKSKNHRQEEQQQHIIEANTQTVHNVQNSHRIVPFVPCRWSRLKATCEEKNKKPNQIVKKFKVWASLSLIRTSTSSVCFCVCDSVWVVCRCAGEQRCVLLHWESTSQQQQRSRQSTFMKRSKQVSYKNMLMANGSINAVPWNVCLAPSFSW